MALDLENRRNKRILRVTKTEEISAFKCHQLDLRLSNTISQMKTLCHPKCQNFNKNG